MSTYPAAEKTKQRIINAAGELAAELGITRVTTRAVAQRSGENQGSIYYHFKNRQALLEAVIEAVLADSPALEFDTGELKPSETRPAKLSRMVRGMVHRQIVWLFFNDKPKWHSQLFYKLMGADEPFCSLFEQQVLSRIDSKTHELMQQIDPDISRSTSTLYGLLIYSPLIVHSAHRTVILRRIGKATYPLEYLIQLEDLLY